MARKKLQEPEKWITVNGQHLPVYPGGIIGQPGQKEPDKTTKKNDERQRRHDILTKEGMSDKDASLYLDYEEKAKQLERELNVEMSSTGEGKHSKGWREEQQKQIDDLKNKAQNLRYGQKKSDTNTAWKDKETGASITHNPEGFTPDFHGGKTYKYRVATKNELGGSKYDYFNSEDEVNSFLAGRKNKNETPSRNARYDTSSPKKTGLKTNLPSAGEKFLKETTAKQDELKAMFKNSPDTTLIATRKAQGGLVDEYTISKSGKGISMSYRQTGKNGKSFGGGATTVSGYWDVAQRMNSMEKSGMKFKLATTSKNARYDTSRSNKKNAYEGKSISQLQSILKNLRAGAAITGTSSGTARQIAEIEQEIARRKKK